jgi:SAM-dependent methyltransferase
MPGSMPEGKQFIKDYLMDVDTKIHKIKRILDIGPGSGNYYDLMMAEGEYEKYPGGKLNSFHVEWVAVEIWEPYIEAFNLNRKYSQIIISDVNYLDWEKLGYFDIIIFGDVIEHMPIWDAKEVLRKAALHSDFIVMSLPIVDFPQGASYGNEHEAHVEQYSSKRVREELLAGFEIEASLEGEIIGVYIF